MSTFITLPDLLTKMGVFRQRHSIVLATGCFDILHSEHIKFLQAAKSKGDILVVGVESDRRVNELKGSGRPINGLQKRVDNLIKTSLPDFIFPLPQKFGASADHELLISRLRPTILAVSSHTLHMDEKKAMVSRHGGELRVVLSHNPKISTSEIVKRGCST